MTELNITDEELEFILSSETLSDWAPYSLAMRCVMFHRRFPNRWLKTWQLSLIMRKAGLLMKKVLVTNAPARMTQRLEKFENEIISLHNRVEAIIASGGHLIFCDEAIFAARGF